MTIWYILYSFGTLFLVLVPCTKKHLATLYPTPCLLKETMYIFSNLDFGDHVHFSGFVRHFHLFFGRKPLLVQTPVDPVCT
jgi:hypothetical protein